MAKSLDQIIDEWNKDSGCIVAQKGIEEKTFKRIPFSSATANYMTYGGMPRGKAVEFFGPEGSGKTTSALDMIAQAQRIFEEEYEAELERLQSIKPSGVKQERELKAQLENLKVKKCVYFDLENTLDLEWARLLGVDVDNMYLVTPESDSAEKVLQKLLDMLDTGEVGLLVLDSVPHLVPQVIFEESMEKKSYGGVSGPMSVFCSRVPPHLSKSDALLIIINQEREDIDNPYSSYSTPGGRALKHLYTARIRFRKGNLIDEGNREVPSRTPNPAGNIVQMEIIKSKAFKPNRRLGSYTLKYYEGIDELADLVTMAMTYNCVMQAGSWFSFVDPDTGEIITDPDGNELKFQGMAKLLQFLREDEFMYEELKETVLAKIQEG